MDKSDEELVVPPGLKHFEQEFGPILTKVVCRFVAMFNEYGTFIRILEEMQQTRSILTDFHVSLIAAVIFILDHYMQNANVSEQRFIKELARIKFQDNLLSIPFIEKDLPAYVHSLMQLMGHDSSKNSQGVFTEKLDNWMFMLKNMVTCVNRHHGFRRALVASSMFHRDSSRLLTAYYQVKGDGSSSNSKITSDETRAEKQLCVKKSKKPIAKTKDSSDFIRDELQRLADLNRHGMDPDAFAMAFFKDNSDSDDDDTPERDDKIQNGGASSSSAFDQVLEDEATPDVTDSFAHAQVTFSDIDDSVNKYRGRPLTPPSSVSGTATCDDLSDIMEPPEID